MVILHVIYDKTPSLAVESGHEWNPVVDIVKVIGEGTMYLSLFKKFDNLMIALIRGMDDSNSQTVKKEP
jgi:hypothetical protein